MNNFTISIEAGELNVKVHQARRPLHELLDFASRQNPKRGFLFVSKVLGKHIPVQPSIMRGVYDELAKLVNTGPTTYVVGMAETATGLGAGVADSLSRLQNKPVYYQHTTRHKSDLPLWLSMDECHSHAVDHLLYEPHKSCRQGIVSARRLVLVDDEITTGRSLGLLASRLLAHLPMIDEVVIVSLVSWLDNQHRDVLLELPVPVRMVTLLDGTFDFFPDPDFKVSLPDKVDTEVVTGPRHTEFGRYGMEMPYCGPVPEIEGRNSLRVIADGEHLYWPFLIAEKAEKQGRTVLFQSSTRSPVLSGGAIVHKTAFSVDHRPIEHYIYNLPPTGALSEQVIMLLENESNRAQHGLGKLFPMYQVMEEANV